MNAEHPPDFQDWLARTARLSRERRSLDDVLSEDWLPDDPA